MTIMLRYFAAMAGLLVAAAVLGQTLILTNLKPVVAKAQGKPSTNSISEFRSQLNRLPDAPAAASTIVNELPPVASGIKISDFLQPTAIPLSAAPDDVGAFRFLCAPSHNAFDDPVVYPGQPGKSHLHTFFGNTKTDANSTYARLRMSGDSTCNDILNRSAYWISALMTGAGKVVMPDYLAVYYKRAPASDQRCKTTASACIALPRGLRYVFGFNMLDPASTPTDTTKRWWNCDGPGAVGGHFATITEAMKGCPVGARLGAVVVAPDCWDGKNLDSNDHRSHMAWRYFNGTRRDAVCPKTHSYIIPQFTLGAWYTITAATTDLYLASDRMPGMSAMEPGSTLHADWFGAWDDLTKDLWTANCIDKMLNCSGGNLGNGSGMKQLSGYDLPSGRPLVDPPSR